MSSIMETAYGVASYLCQYADGRVHCSLILLKFRLALNKTMMIPRLELAATTLAVQIHMMLLRELDLDISKITYHCVKLHK